MDARVAKERKSANEAVSIPMRNSEQRIVLVAWFVAMFADFSGHDEASLSLYKGVQSKVYAVGLL